MRKIVTSVCRKLTFIVIVSLLIVISFIGVVRANPYYYKPIIKVISPSNYTNSSEVNLIVDVGVFFKYQWEEVKWLNYTVDENTQIPLTTHWIGADKEDGGIQLFEAQDRLLGLSDGVHSILIQGESTFNTSITKTISFIVDTQKPVISFISPQNKTYTNNTVSMQFTVSESNLNMSYSLDNQLNTTMIGESILKQLSVGSHSLVVYAIDRAGNIGSTNIVYFSIETQKQTAPDQTPTVKPDSNYQGTQQTGQPMPVFIIVGIITIAVAIVSVSLLLYFKKHKH